MTDQTKAPLLTTSEAADAVNRAKAMMSHASLPILARAMDDLDDLYFAYERILTSAPSTPPSSAPETRTLLDEFHDACVDCYGCHAPTLDGGGPHVDKVYRLKAQIAELLRAASSATEGV